MNRYSFSALKDLYKYYMAQMRAWSRVRDIEIRKDAVDSQLNSKKATPAPAPAPVQQSDEELDEADLDEFLDWRQKKT